MNEIKLKDLIEIKKGKKVNNIFSEPSDHLLRYIQISDLRNDNNLQFVNKDDQNVVKVNKHDVLIAWDGANAGTVGYGLEGSIGSTIAFLRCDTSKINPSFLAYFLKANFNYLRDTSTGATIPHLSRGAINSMTIRIPSLNDQKQIVDILDKSTELLKLKEKSLTVLKKLEESYFYKIFGDPVINKNHWTMKTLKEVSVRFSDGPFGSNLKTEHYTTEGIRVIRLQNIGEGKFINDDQAYISKEHFNKLKKHRCEPGDVLIATMGTPNLRACLLPEYISEAINKADCIQCKPDLSKVLPEYLSSLLNTSSILSAVSNLIHGQTRTRISMGQLSKFIIPIPPIELQKKYKEIIKGIDFKKDISRKSLIKLEELHQNLLIRAFNGQLISKEKVG